MNDLIARLEAATEGSEELNDAIDFELFGSDEARPYTTSLDAALTLVPKGRDWEVSYIRELYR